MSARSTSRPKSSCETVGLRHCPGLVAKSSGTAVPFAASYASCPVANAQQNGDGDPNYSGACVLIASDADRQGGSGNGPAYVSGPVTVIGDGNGRSF